MNVALQRDGLTVVASVSGDIDMANTASLSAAIFGGIDVNDVALVLDLTDVRYLDSAGVQMLFDIARRLETGRRAFGVAISETSPTRAVLKISHLDEIAVMRASVDECIDHITTRGGPLT